MDKISALDIKITRERLVKKQEGMCPICRRPIKDPVLDHDHSTGAIRDALCRNCNRMEGKVLHWVNTVPGVNAEIIRSLARYWIRHRINRHKLLHPGKRKRKRKTKHNKESRNGKLSS